MSDKVRENQRERLKENGSSDDDDPSAKRMKCRVAVFFRMGRVVAVGRVVDDPCVE